MPLQFAFSARDCVGNAIKAQTLTLQPQYSLLLRFWGVRSAIVEGVQRPRSESVVAVSAGNVPSANRVRMGRRSRTGCEASQLKVACREDPLMPVLFSLAIHDAVVEALFACHDDVSSPHHTRPRHHLLGEKLETGAGTRLHGEGTSSKREAKKPRRISGKMFNQERFACSGRQWVPDNSWRNQSPRCWLKSENCNPWLPC